MVDPATISYLLSSVASTAKIIEFGLGLASKRASEKEIDDTAKLAETNAAKRFGKTSATVVAMSKGGWSKDIVDTLREEIEETKKRTIRIIKNKNFDDHDRNKRLTDERRNFCAALAQIRNFNGGKLPPDLQEEWNQTCHDYEP
jgi:hypothetical protein